MFRKLFKKETKTVKKARVHKVKILWGYDTPWYCNLTDKDIKRFEQNPDVLDILILG